MPRLEFPNASRFNKNGEFDWNKTVLIINQQDYFDMAALNVLVYQNTFPEGHEIGVENIQHGERVGTNGELRLSPAPGQW